MASRVKAPASMGEGVASASQTRSTVTTGAARLKSRCSAQHVASVTPREPMRCSCLHAAALASAAPMVDARMQKEGPCGERAPL